MIENRAATLLQASAARVINDADQQPEPARGQLPLFLEKPQQTSTARACQRRPDTIIEMRVLSNARNSVASLTQTPDQTRIRQQRQFL